MHTYINESTVKSFQIINEEIFWNILIVIEYDNLSAKQLHNYILSLWFFYFISDCTYILGIYRCMYG